MTLAQVHALARVFQQDAPHRGVLVQDTNLTWEEAMGPAYMDAMQSQWRSLRDGIANEIRNMHGDKMKAVFLDHAGDCE